MLQIAVGDIIGIEPELNSAIIQQVVIGMSYLYIIGTIEMNGGVNITTDAPGLAKRATIIGARVRSRTEVGCCAASITQSPSIAPSRIRSYWLGADPPSCMKGQVRQSMR